MSKKIAVIGGGLAGIAAARRAHSAGAEVHLFERSAKLGGRVSHEIIDGFVIDAGFQVINLNYPELRRLLKEKPKAKPIFGNFSYLNSSGKRREFTPLQINDLLSTRGGNIFEKIALLNYVLGSSKQVPTLSEASKKFPHLYQNLISPFLKGVFLTEPEHVHPAIAHKLISYFLKGRPQLIDGGAGNLALALVAPLPATSVHTNAVVEEVSDQGGKKLLRVIEDGITRHYDGFDGVVLATNTNFAGLPDQPIINERAWLASTTVFHGVPKLNKSYKKLFIGGSFVNSLAISLANPTYAPLDKTLIATTYLGELSDAQCEEHFAEIAALYGLKLSDLHTVAIKRISNSLPLFSDKPIAAPALPGIAYAGDSFVEPSQNGALASGRIAAESLL
jgi:hypothetical protein